MTRPFDAYHVWLGIPPHEQPPDHYRLLGIPLFEHDPDVIEQAAERQAAFLRQMEAGPHGETAQRLLQEIAQARTTLLHPTSRTTYDEVLRHLKAGKAAAASATSGASTVRSMPAPLEGTTEQPQPSSRIVTPTANRVAAKGGSASWTGLPRRAGLYLWKHPGLAAGLAALVLIGGGLYLVWESVPRRSGGGLDSRPPAGLAQGDPAVRQGTAPQELPASGLAEARKPGTDALGSGRDSSSGKGPASTPNPPGPPPSSAGPSGAANSSSSSAGAQSAGAPSVPNPPSAAEELLPGMLGRITVGGEDLGVMVRYTPGESFGQGEIDQLLTRYGLEKANVEIRLEGVLRISGQNLPNIVGVKMAVASPLVDSGGVELSLNGHPLPLRVFREGEPPKVELGVPLKEYRLAWTLKGADLGPENRLTVQLRPRQEPMEITVGYDAALLKACQSLPTLGMHALNQELTELAVEDLAGQTEMEPHPTQGPADVADARLPVPSYSDQDAAKSAFRQKYRKELADANRPETRSLLARTLLTESEQEADATMRYVLLLEARDLAVNAGDPFLAVQIGESMAAHFRRNVWDVHLETLKEVRKSKLAISREPALTVLQSLGRAAIRADEYDAAQSLGEIGEGIAQDARDLALRDAFKQARERAESLKAGYQAIQSALAVLQTNDSDPAANETVGRFYCMVKQDWKKGLPYLAKGGHAVLRAAAQGDLNAPTSPTAQLRVADDWWAFAESLEGAEQAAVRRRAGYWYLKTEQAQSGENLARVQQRLVESGRVIDLIAAAITRKAAFLGTWQTGRGFLVSSREPLPKVVFQVFPPEEYDVLLGVQPLPAPTPPRASSGQSPPPIPGQGAFLIGLAIGRSSAVATLDWLQPAGNSRHVFLANYNGKGPDPANPTLHTAQVFQPDRPCSIRCEVRMNTIRVQANGVPVIEFQGDLNGFSLPRELGVSLSRRIFLGTVLRSFQIHQAVLRDIGE